jgi:hypothetical protein
MHCLLPCCVDSVLTGFPYIPLLFGFALVACEGLAFGLFVVLEFQLSCARKPLVMMMKGA